MLELITPSGQILKTLQYDQTKSVHPQQIYNGYWFEVTNRGLLPYNFQNKCQINAGRYVVTKNIEQKVLLDSIQNIHCYFRYPDKKGMLLSVNPYASHCWLYQKAKKLYQYQIQLYLNGKLLQNTNESLINVIKEKCIVHILPIKKQNFLKKIYLVEPFSNHKEYEITGINLQNQVKWLKQKATKLINSNANGMYLIFSGRIMKDYNQLKYYKLTQNSSIYIITDQNSFKKISLKEYSQILNNAQSPSSSLQKLKASYKSKPTTINPVLFLNQSVNCQNSLQFYETKCGRKISEHQNNQITNVDGKKGFKDVRTVRNQQGQIIQVDTNQQIRNVDQYGNTHEMCVKKIQKQGKTVEIKTQKTFDKDGLLMSDIQIIEKQIQKDGSFHLHQHDIMKMQKSKYEVEVQKDAHCNSDGKIIDKKTEISYTQQYQNGKINRHQEVSIQKQGKTHKITADVNTSQDGKITQIEKVETIIIKQKQGLIHTHQNSQIKGHNSVISIKRDTIQCQNQQNNKQQIQYNISEENPDGSVHTQNKKTIQQGVLLNNIQQQQLNNARVILIDAPKNPITGKQSKYHKVTIVQDTVTTPKGSKKQQHYEQEVVFDGQKIHHHDKRQIKMNGQSHYRERDEQQDNQGNILREHIQQKDISQDCNHHIHEHITKIDSENNKIHTVINDKQINEKGELLKNQQDVIDAEDKLGSLVEIKQNEIVEQSDKMYRKYQERVYNKEGQTLSQKLYEDEKPNQKNINKYQDLDDEQFQKHEKEMIDDILNQVEDKIISQQGQIQKEQNQNNQTDIRDKKVRYATIQRSQLNDKNGNKIKENIQYTVDTLGNDQKVHQIKTNIISQNNKMTIQTDEYSLEQNGDKSLLEHNTQIIRQDNQGKIYKKSSNLIDKNKEHQIKRDDKTVKWIDEDRQNLGSINMNTLKLDNEEQTIYKIKVKELQGGEWQFQAYFDDIVGDIAQKLSNLIGVQQENMKFYCDGQEIFEYQMLVEVGVFRDLAIYLQIVDDNV